MATACRPHLASGAMPSDELVGDQALQLGPHQPLDEQGQMAAYHPGEAILSMRPTTRGPSQTSTTGCALFSFTATVRAAASDAHSTFSAE